MQVTFRLNAYSKITSVFFLVYLWGELFWVGERLFSIIVPHVSRKGKEGKESVWPRRLLHRKAHFLGTIIDETSFRFPINMSVGLPVSLKSPQTGRIPDHTCWCRGLLSSSSKEIFWTPTRYCCSWLEGKHQAILPGFPSVLKELFDPSRSPPNVPGSLTKHWVWQWQGDGTHSIPSQVLIC